MAYKMLLFGEKRAVVFLQVSTWVFGLHSQLYPSRSVRACSVHFEKCQRCCRLVNCTSYSSCCCDLLRIFSAVVEHICRVVTSEPIENHEHSNSISWPSERFDSVEDYNHASILRELSRSHKSKPTFSSITHHEGDFVVHDFSEGLGSHIGSIGPRQYGPPSRLRADQRPAKPASKVMSMS